MKLLPFLQSRLTLWMPILCNAVDSIVLHTPKLSTTLSWRGFPSHRKATLLLELDKCGLHCRCIVGLIEIFIICVHVWHLKHFAAIFSVLYSSTVDHSDCWYTSYGYNYCRLHPFRCLVLVQKCAGIAMLRTWERSTSRVSRWFCRRTMSLVEAHARIHDFDSTQ